MSQDRIRELWTRALSGERLPAADEQELLAALRGDESLRRELLDDAELHGALRARGLGRRNEEGFLRAVATGTAASDRESRFLRRLEGRIAGERRSRMTWFVPALAAAGLLVAALLAWPSRRETPEPVATPKVRPKESAPKVAPPPPPEVHRPEPPRPEPEPPPPPPEPPRPEPPKPAPPQQTPPPKPPAPPPPPTVTALAKLEGIVGEATVLGAPARNGRELFAGQDVVTTGQAQALVVFGDGTRLDLAGDTAVRNLKADGEGKRATLVRGVLVADVAKQPHPMVLATPHGEVAVLGTRLRLGVEKTSTLLEVAEGRVAFRRLADGRSLDLAGGQYALLAPGVEFVVRPMAQAAPKDDTKPYPGVDQRRVDAAIARGVEWLVKQPLDTQRGYSAHAMVLYTLLHAKANPQHPAFQSLLKAVLEAPIERTYCAAFQAMFLSEFDAAKYQSRIAQCGQFLLDNQNEDGGWGYGDPTTYPTPIVSPAKDVATPGGRAKREPTRPKNVLTLKRQRYGGPSDNSNSQYATLGLRACLEAGVAFPRESLELAKKYWESHQKEDGGWAYSGGGGTSYGSMSVGGLGALIICKHHLGEGWRADPKVLKAVDWVTKNFTVAMNPGKESWYFYYLYALERAGVFTNLRSFGDHDWYKEGANHLLGLQNPDGSWHQSGQGKESSGPIPDTCWAILFLRRRTPPLQDVPSVDRFNVRPAGK